MKEHRIQIGVIADDFTGASDIASFLAASGHSTILFDSTPEQKETPDCDCIVIALKSRSVKPDQAIQMVSDAYRFLDQIGAEKIYFKYCSTFDSTRQGNIGPVLDWMLAESGQQYTVLCPSLPVNGRIVHNGILYVNNVPLAESPMKNHPLNPMWDSHLKNLMEAQSRYPVYPIGTLYKDSVALQEQIRAHADSSKHFYFVPDYVNETDGQMIAAAFSDLRILSGGSGLAQYLLSPVDKPKQDKEPKTAEAGKSVIICGSCSQATRKQISWYQAHGGRTCSIDIEQLLEHPESARFYKEILKENSGTILFYSCGPETMLDRRNTAHFQAVSEAIEQLNAELGVSARRLGYQKIIVAGGETSGAVARALGFHSYYIGATIDPGVPVLKPCQQPGIQLVFKSGNFGSVSFFEKALKTQ